MDVNDLYQFVLVLVLVGIVLGVGLTVLSKFANTSTLQSDIVAQEAVNDTIDAIAEIPSNWLGVVVIVVVAAIILGLVLRSFGGPGAR